MFAFSAASNAKLAQLDPRLVKVVRRALSYGVMDFTVISTLRTPEEQAEKVAKGLSRTHNSKHLAGPDGKARAIDLAPYPVDWKDERRFMVLAGLMLAAAAECEVKVRPGMDFNGDGNLHDDKLFDPGHFELA